MWNKTLFAALAVAALALPACGMVMPPGGGGRGPIAPRPVAPPGYVYQWSPPVYQTVTDQVWIPEKIEWVDQWMEIVPGHLELVKRQVVTPGHYETRMRTVLVSDGRWQLVMVEPLPPPPVIIYPPVVIQPPRTVVVISPPTVGVDCYAPGGVSDDLSKFSGLREWPK